MTKTIFFSVGEPSGDQHAARLIQQFSDRDGLAPTEPIRCRGFGGSAMRDAGCAIDLDLTQHAVVGLLEVLPKLREFFQFADQAEAIFAEGGVDAVVLVDFPGFNWHIARRAKAFGIPVYYYCPPQLWAWGGWRVRKMKRFVDHVLTVLPMETEFFSDAGIPVTQVGHPFFDAVAEQKLDAAIMNQFQRQSRAGEVTVAVLPGSRNHEVQRNFPLMLEAMRRLSAEFNRDGRLLAKGLSVRFAVAAYKDQHCLWCRNQLQESDAELPVDFFVGRCSEVVEAAHCAMMVSGSVSLELMARRTPAAVVYRVGRFLHAVGRTLVRVDSMTLPNLMGPTKVMPEMVSVGRPEPAIEFLTQTIGSLLADRFYYQTTVDELAALRDQFGRTGASRRAAAWILDQWAIAHANSESNLGVESDVPQTQWRKAA